MLQQVLEKIEQVQQKLEKHGYPRIEIMSVEVCKLPKGVAGQALPYANEIKISRDYFQEHSNYVLGVTVPHEVCHLYVSKYHRFAKQAHGPEFRAIMNLLGLDGKTHHNMKIAGMERRKNTVKRYIYKAEQSGTPFKLTTSQHKKMQTNPRAFIMKRTGESLVYTGKVVKV